MMGGTRRIASSADEAHVGLRLFLADVDAKVVSAREFSPDQHAFIDRRANSGLEETMISAFHELLKTQWQTQGIPDLRITPFLSAIHKVARIFSELGIFP
jgi:hypothetical protein